MTNWDDINADCLSVVLSFLNIRELAIISSVSKDLHTQSKRPKKMINNSVTKIQKIYKIYINKSRFLHSIRNNPFFFRYRPRLIYEIYNYNRRLPKAGDKHIIVDLISFLNERHVIRLKPHVLEECKDVTNMKIFLKKLSLSQLLAIRYTY